MIVADVIARARTLLQRFALELHVDQQMFAALTDEQRRVLDSLVLIANTAYALPGEACVEADVSEMESPWPLPDDYWRPRRFTLEYQNGRKRQIILVPERYGFHLPVRVPSAYIRQNRIYPVDGNPAEFEDRRHGWNGVKKVEMLYLTEPAAVEGVQDELSVTNDCIGYLSAFLAAREALLSAEGALAVQSIQQRATTEWESLVERVKEHPGQVPVGFNRE